MFFLHINIYIFIQWAVLVSQWRVEALSSSAVSQLSDDWLHKVDQLYVLFDMFLSENM